MPSLTFNEIDFCNMGTLLVFSSSDIPVGTWKVSLDEVALRLGVSTKKLKLAAIYSNVYPGNCSSLDF
jgi:hypothetical protein